MTYVWNRFKADKLINTNRLKLAITIKIIYLPGFSILSGIEILFHLVQFFLRKTQEQVLRCRGDKKTKKNREAGTSAGTDGTAGGV